MNILIENFMIKKNSNFKAFFIIKSYKKYSFSKTVDYSLLIKAFNDKHFSIYQLTTLADSFSIKYKKFTINLNES